MDYERTVFLEASPDAVFDHTASLAGFRQLFPFPLDWRDGPTGRWSEGDVLDFRFRVGPLRIRHTARIVAFEPGHRFVDEMTRGVFCRFRHEHQYRTYRDGTPDDGSGGLDPRVRQPRRPVAGPPRARPSVSQASRRPASALPGGTTMNRTQFRRLADTVRDNRWLETSNTKGLATLVVEMALLAVTLRLLARTGPSDIGYWLLEATAGLLLFRWFVLLHECGHGTLFRRRAVNTVVGHLASILCLMPYFTWRRIHREHHRWVGVIDKDPTQAHLLELRRHGQIKNALFRGVWRLWLPIPYVTFIARVFWLAPLRWSREGKTGDALKGAGSNAVILASHAVLMGTIGVLPWIALAGPALFVFAFVLENTSIPQHTELFPHLSEDHPAPIPRLEQDDVTRSSHIPDWLSVVLALSFNRHAEHHLFPGVPWYRLNRIRDLLLSSGYRHPHEVPYLTYMGKLRRRDPVRLFRVPSPQESDR